MSYRTYVEHTQIFGNNEYYIEWIEFIKSQGIEVDEDDGFYEGEITDVMGAVTAIERVIERLELDRREQIKKFEREYKNVDLDENDTQELCTTSIFDFRRTYDRLIENRKKTLDDKYNNSITDEMRMLYENGYAFMSLAFIEACEDKVERDKHYAVPGHFFCWKLKEGESIHVSAG